MTIRFPEPESESESDELGDGYEEEEEESSFEKDLLTSNSEEEESDEMGDRKVPDFFDAAEMERFVQDAEENGEDDEVAELIMGGDELDGDIGEIGYDDFFAENPNAMEGEIDEEEEVDNDEFDFVESGAGQRSAIELRGDRIVKEIENREQSLVEPAAWGLQGEVTKTERPAESLLESYVDFDQVMSAAPRPDAILNAEIESKIQSRILEGTWDNITRRRESTRAPAPRVRAQLNHAQSEKGLGELFEQAYLRAVDLEGLNDASESLSAPQKKAQLLFASLCRSLDSLTNERFRPSAPKPKDATVRSNKTAAVLLEEVAPLGRGTTTSALAPEELASGTRSDLLGATEETREDRRRRRRQRKEAAKRRASEKEASKRARAAVDPVFAQKMRQEKEVAAVATVKGTTMGESSKGGTRAGKAFKSTAFFTGLHEEQQGLAEPKKKKTKVQSANQYKL